MSDHYHKVEYLCRKCATIQEQFVKCSSDLDDLFAPLCTKCKEGNMWLGKFDMTREYPGSVVSPIQL